MFFPRKNLGQKKLKRKKNFLVKFVKTFQKSLDFRIKEYI